MEYTHSMFGRVFSSRDSNSIANRISVQFRLFLFPPLRSGGCVGESINLIQTEFDIQPDRYRSRHMYVLIVIHQLHWRLQAHTQTPQIKQYQIPLHIKFFSVFKFVIRDDDFFFMFWCNKLQFRAWFAR